MEAVEKRPGQWKEGEGQQDVTGPSHAGVKLTQGAPQAHGPQLLHHRAPSPLLLLQAERAPPALCTCPLQTPRAHSLPAPVPVQTPPSGTLGTLLALITAAWATVPEGLF